MPRSKRGRVELNQKNEEEHASTATNPKSKAKKRKRKSGESIDTSECKKKKGDKTRDGFDENGELCHVLQEEDFDADYHTDVEAEEERRQRAEESQKMQQHHTKMQQHHTKYNVQKNEEYYKVTEEGVLLSEKARLIVEAFNKDVLQKQREFRNREVDHPRPEKISSHYPNCGCGHSSDESDTSSSYSGSESEEEEEEETKSKKKKTTENEEDGKKKRKRQGGRWRKRSKATTNPQSAAIREEVEWRRSHPCALNSDICFNVPLLMNDGPLCRCSYNAKKTGIRHFYYDGEREQPHAQPDFRCSPSKLYHYVLCIEPYPGSQARRASRIIHNGKVYLLEGLSLFFHRPLPKVFPREPQTKWSLDYKIQLKEAPVPIGTFAIEELESWFEYTFYSVLELYDLQRHVAEVREEVGCPIYHVMPRYTRQLRGDATELAPMSIVLSHLHASFTNLLVDSELARKLRDSEKMANDFCQEEKGQLITHPAKKPCTIRADMVDRHNIFLGKGDGFPVITHYAMRPTIYTLHGRPEYMQAVSTLARMRETARRPDSTPEDRENVSKQEAVVSKMRSESVHKKDTTVSFSSQGFRRTGYQADITIHALLMTVAVEHARYHWSLTLLEERVGYTFRDRTLAELALTHPSYTTSYGMNVDQAKNTLFNCGVRELKKKRSDMSAVQRRYFAELRELRKGHNKRKGMAAIFDMMSRMPDPKKLQISAGMHSERLEFLGDVVVELIVTVHLFFLLPDHDEGALATFRSALVQNKNLAVLAERLGLERLMLYTHGSDLCHENEQRHAMANAFEAFMAAIFLDSGQIDHCERIYGEAMFRADPETHKIWSNLRQHPLKAEYSPSDRHLIPTSQTLQKLTQFEDMIGMKFQHIRVLAKAFCRAGGTFSTLTKGDNQRLELLGDTVLQMIVTIHLYKTYPLHHEGHLSLLRTCLVSNRTQSLICDDLAMTKYIVLPNHMRNRSQPSMRIKDKADLVESLLGAIYVDRGWEYCKAFCRICFFPRLKYFIESEKWNDPKSQLQQICLSMPRTIKGETYHGTSMPEYRTVAIHGPTNTREYQIAIHFRGSRLALGKGNTLHIAQMSAASEALSRIATVYPEQWKIVQRKQHRLTSGGAKHSSTGGVGAGANGQASTTNEARTESSPTLSDRSARVAPAARTHMAAAAGRRLPKGSQGRDSGGGAQQPAPATPSPVPLFSLIPRAPPAMSAATTSGNPFYPPAPQPLMHSHIYPPANSVRNPPQVPSFRSQPPSLLGHSGGPYTYHPKPHSSPYIPYHSSGKPMPYIRSDLPQPSHITMQVNQMRPPQSSAPPVIPHHVQAPPAFRNGTKQPPPRSLFSFNQPFKRM